MARNDGSWIGNDDEVVHLPSPPAISDANDTPPNMGSEDNVVDVQKNN